MLTLGILDDHFNEPKSASLHGYLLAEYCGFFFSSESLSPYTSWLSTISDTDALLAEWGKGGVVTVDMGGRIRLWETGLEHLQRSLMEWRSMIGQGDGHMQVLLTLTLLLKGTHSGMNFIPNTTIMNTSNPPTQI